MFDPGRRLIRSTIYFQALPAGNPPRLLCEVRTEDPAVPLALFIVGPVVPTRLMADGTELVFETCDLAELIVEAKDKGERPVQLRAVKADALTTLFVLELEPMQMMPWGPWSVAMHVNKLR